MIVLLGGATHSGKTKLAQRLLERYHVPYLSIDHLKMGLIRSGITSLTPCDDAALTPYLWNIVKEIIKTAIENGQHLIVEGCYIPFDWAADFTADYLKEIRCFYIILSEAYLNNHFHAVKAHANDIEHRMDDTDLSLAKLIEENNRNLEQCRRHGCAYLLIDDMYHIDIETFSDFFKPFNTSN